MDLTQAPGVVHVKAYRLFYRKGRSSNSYSYRQEVIFGEEELKRRIALKRPHLVHWEIAVAWNCHQCRKTGPWVQGWRNMLGRSGGANGWANPVLICSDECAEKHLSGYTPAPYLQIANEPIPHHKKRLMRARWEAFQRDREALTQTREHRRVPMLHEGKGVGWCRWCGKAVAPPRKTWHQECLRTYFLHTERTAQYRYLRERDGDRCTVEGCDQPGVEVDHVTPLWRVRHLPDIERLPYYGPDNLALLCSDHHKAKTAREAGERASERVDITDG